MKKLFFLIFVFIWYSSSSQNICSFTSLEERIESCITSYTPYSDNIVATGVIDNILAKIHLNNKYFITKTCRGINNAIALKYDNLNYIILDFEWMESMKYGKNDWFHLLVIGHEIGHHILNHTEKTERTLEAKRQKELDADEFAGFVLGVYGAPSKEINLILNKFPNSNQANSTHPDKNQRELAIKKGYESASRNEVSSLIKQLTKDVAFNLSSYPYLINIARKKFNEFLDSKNQISRNEAIVKYQEIIRFFDNPQFAYELGALFLSNGQIENYHSSLELAYQKSKDEKYILELIGSIISIADEKRYEKLEKYNYVLNSVNSNKYYETNCLQGIIKYYLYLARKDIRTKGINFKYVQKVEQFASNYLAILKNESTNQENLNSTAELHNALGLCGLLKEDYTSAFEYFQEARDDFKNAKQYDKQLEDVYKYYSLNYFAVQYNIALAAVRLREWESGIMALLDYDMALQKLNSDQLGYLLQIDKNIDSKTYYLKGRCHHGLGNFASAIQFFNEAIMYEKNNYIIYYYRGISYLGLNKNELACKDFKYACENNINDACYRYNTECK